MSPTNQYIQNHKYDLYFLFELYSLEAVEADFSIIYLFVFLRLGQTDCRESSQVGPLFWVYSSYLLLHCITACGDVSELIKMQFLQRNSSSPRR